MGSHVRIGEGWGLMCGWRTVHLANVHILRFIVKICKKVLIWPSQLAVK